MLDSRKDESRSSTASAILCLALGGLVTSACGSGQGVMGGGPGDNQGADGTAWIYGTWVGTFTSKAEGSETLSARAVFDHENERAGAFAISLADDESTTVSGSYQDFGGTSLMLYIEKSGVSTIGIAGSRATLDYEIIGKDLKLYNDRATMKLVREGKPGDDNGSKPDNETEQPESLLGRWTCDDSTGLLWQVDVRSDSAASLEVFDKKGGQSLKMDGALAAASGSNAFDHVITITASAESKYVGRELGIKRTSLSTLHLHWPGERARDLDCQRR